MKELRALFVAAASDAVDVSDRVEKIAEAFATMGPLIALAEEPLQTAKDLQDLQSLVRLQMWSLSYLSRPNTHEEKRLRDAGFGHYVDQCKAILTALEDVLGNRY